MRTSLSWSEKVQQNKSKCINEASTIKQQKKDKKTLKRHRQLIENVQQYKHKAGVFNNTTLKGRPLMKVQYISIFMEKPKIKKDNIPRHKEIEPHPSDDFIMTNGDQTNEQTLNKDDKYEPIMTETLKCLKKWVDGIENNSKVIHINFNQMDKDLQFEYSLCNENKNILPPNYFRNIYYYYRNAAKDDYYYSKYNAKNQSFFAVSNSIVHYILYYATPTQWDEIISKVRNKNDALKVVKYGAKIIKLLLKNKVISLHSYFTGTYIGINIYETIRDCLWKNNSVTIHKYYFGSNNNNKIFKQKCMDIYCDLFLFCIRLSNKKEAIVKIKCNGHDWWHENIFPTQLRGMKRGKSFMPNSIIQRLLFRGIPPFLVYKRFNQFMWNEAVEITFDKNINEFNTLFKKAMSAETTENMQQKIAFCTPLTIFPLLIDAKNEMFEIIYQCMVQQNLYCVSEIINIIILYLFCGN
eukprot:123342_1